MLVLTRLILNREYIPMNVLKAFASIICMCNLHVILISSNTPRYFTLFTNAEFEVTLRPTVSRPVSLGVRRPSGTRD
jgi:hypothetical protein